MNSSRIEVDAEALQRLLKALSGEPHEIRELQFTRGFPGDSNPLDILIDEYNKWAKTINLLLQPGEQHGKKKK